MVEFVPTSGLFITLYDEDTLNLYLVNGVYGELRAPEHGEIGSYSKHYAALADAACARQDTHVFLFNKRQIVYGGQIIGSPDHGSFLINGPYSPLGRHVGASINWDESSRNIYSPTEKPGIFLVKKNKNVERCQPYLVRFEDQLGIVGNAIESDELYANLSVLDYPVATNTIKEMSFCTITPGETEILLDLLKKSPENVLQRPRDNIDIEGSPLQFDPSMGIQHLSSARSKFHHDASILANPNLLPPEIRPRNATICRKIPITPFKPSKLDRVDICYYSDEEPIERGTLPNTVIELEWKQAGDTKLLKMVRYIKWLRRLIPNEVNDISFVLLAPSFKDNIWDRVPREFRAMIRLITWRP